MSALVLKESKNTPEVILDPSSNTYIIQGKCFPENAKKYFNPILEWFTFTKITQPITIIISLDYISSSSVISVLELLRHVDKCSKEIGYTVNILWKYEEGDDDMANVAMNYQKLCNLTIQLEEYSS